MKPSSRRSFLMNIVLLAVSVIGSLPPLTAVQAQTALPRPGKKDRCPVCGMFVHKYPEWAAGMIFKDGTRYFHCCPKCMLHNLKHVAKYQPGKTRKDIKTLWITEYYSTRRMKADDVVFIIGSKLVGPMGLDLIPIKGRETAKTFLKDYKGEKILPLNEITPEVIEKVR